MSHDEVLTRHGVYPAACDMGCKRLQNMLYNSHSPSNVITYYRLHMSAASDYGYMNSKTPLTIEIVPNENLL